MLLLALLAAVPQPGELKLFQDWTVGCDNGRACQAVGLVPENAPGDGLATMSVRRGAEAGALPVIAFALHEATAAGVSADGRRLPIRLVEKGYGPEVAPADVPAVMAAIKSARRLELLGANGAVVANVSLAGSSAALLYMDEQQQPGRALLPVVRAAPRPTGAAIQLSASRVKALRKQYHCTLDEVGGPDSVEISALDPIRTLVLLACGSGAYNVSSIPFVAEQRGRNVAIRLAPFDIRPGWWENGQPLLVNSEWDPKRGLLLSFSKGRGLGDCGTDSEFAWDGARFRLVKQAEMEECRGSVDYITTWRVQVVRP